MELSEFQLTEVLGAVEVRLRCADRTPADKVRNGQLVTALIEVTLECQTVQRCDVVTEEHRKGDTQRQFPLGWLLTGIKRCAAQGCPAVNKLSDLRCSQFAVIPALANADQ